MWFNGANNQNCLLKIANILLVTKEEEIQIIQIFIHNLSISYRSEINSEDDVIWNEDHWAEYAQEYARGELYNRIKWFFVVGGILLVLYCSIIIHLMRLLFPWGNILLIIQEHNVSRLHTVLSG